MKTLYQRILLTLDGSELAAQAIPHAVAIAEHFDSELVLFEVIPPAERRPVTRALMPDDIRRIENGIQQHEQAAVQAAERTLIEQATALALPSTRMRAAVRIGAPAEQILAYAQREGIDLIVMCTHGRSGIERQIFGSVAEAVLHGADCPVLLVRALGIADRLQLRSGRHGV